MIDVMTTTRRFLLYDKEGNTINWDMITVKSYEALETLKKEGILDYFELRSGGKGMPVLRIRTRELTKAGTVMVGPDSEIGSPCSECGTQVDEITLPAREDLGGGPYTFERCPRCGLEEH